MKVYIRKSSLKRRRMTGFRRRMATKSGRKIINNQRNVACGRIKKHKAGKRK